LIIYPAIDILNGHCVRLYKGDYGQVTKYSDDPVKTALTFKEAGASHIHIVDLDGAKTGKSENIEVIKRICKETGLSVQTGGGVRTIKRIRELAAANADRIILGTAAIKNPSLVEEAVKEFGKKIVVGIDARNGLAHNGIESPFMKLVTYLIYRSNGLIFVTVLIYRIIQLQ
jgi:phosphoribosylformimino-5-aminoimidazole carboxamide ribotide isomerase